MSVTHETKETMNASMGNLATAASPEPTVCCAMLVNGRPEMVRRAVASFRSQTYERKFLLMLNSGPGSLAEYVGQPGILTGNTFTGATIGALRNAANRMGCNSFDGCDIIAHFDSDDVSGTNRLAEQVALLQASGADCVGYNQAVFWREPQRMSLSEIPGSALNDGCTEMRTEGEAWVYTSTVPKGILGASMLYWRSAWERKPFLDRRTGEDDRWLSGMKVCGVSGVGYPERAAIGPGGVHYLDREPRLIAGVHGGNTSRVNPCEGPREWRRGPELDAYCREKMQL